MLLYIDKSYPRLALSVKNSANEKSISEYIVKRRD